jgi:glutamine amidotransferase/cyclase
LNTATPLTVDPSAETKLTKRIVVALDVRSNDHGDLVVTKGDQYDVRENHKEGVVEGQGGVRNLGKPVALARRYYEEGGDEIAFLNITGFRQGVIEDMPMLKVLEEASKNIFVPLTVGGGIRSYTDPESGQTWTALEVAARYFRAGADKVRAQYWIALHVEEYIEFTLRFIIISLAGEFRERRRRCCRSIDCIGRQEDWSDRN